MVTRTRAFPHLGLLVGLALVGCGEPTSTTDGGTPNPMDGGGTDGAPGDGGDPDPLVCDDDAECSDGQFCTGVERCAPSEPEAGPNGCVSVPMDCGDGSICDEALDECIVDCGVPLDADGDGHRAIECGGDDCDDADANRYPGNIEVCDGEGHDEDCNTDTFGFLDADGDGAASAACCNGTLCGEDCNDADSTVNPRAGDGQPLYCDGVDNDCSGVADEGCPCTEGQTQPCGTPAQLNELGLCRAGTQVCSGGTFTEECIGGVSPQAEVCDEQDNDCDGTVDDGVLRTYVADADGDGFGATGGVTLQACSPPAGYAPNDLDCDDAVLSVNPLATEVCNTRDDDCDAAVDEGVEGTFYQDSDGDGFGNFSSAIDACARPGGYVDNGSDCDDTERAINPPAAETCDGVDNNCDLSIDDGCVCLDGANQACGASDGMGGILTVGECAAGSQRCSDGIWGLCTGGREPTSEACNGRDDDCDGTTDEAVTTTYYLDADGDGFGALASPVEACARPSGYALLSTDCDDGQSGVNPSAAELCDGQDNNCGGGIDEGCSCTNGETQPCGSTDVGACQYGEQLCTGGLWGSCVGSVEPASGESCNGADDDCDGSVDEGVQTTYYQDSDGDGFGTPLSTTLACSVPMGFSRLSSDCDDTMAGVSPAATEVCDGVDNNCSGAPDEGCSCTNGTTRQCGSTDVGACQYGEQLCTGGLWGSCVGSVEPASGESCNGVDDNCNGSVDEGVQTTFYEDSDGDGFGDPASTTQACQQPMGYSRLPSDCDDTIAGINPSATEVCDGIDNNCSGAADEGCDCVNGTTQACGSSEVGACQMGTQLCTGGLWGSCAGGVEPSTELCNNVDDDCDGAVDEFLLVTCYSDNDDDLYPPSGAGSETFCPVAGRAAEGGCPIYWTNRTPGMGADCADNDPQRSPGRTEVCNGVEDDCDADVDEDTLSECAAADGYGACLDGSCGVVGCAPGFGDCDGDAANGCETTTDADTLNCGGCGISCAGGACSGGLCEGVVSVEGGDRHTCARFASGRLACWGNNNNGQLGDGTSTDRAIPAGVSNIVDALEVEAGGFHSCAVLASGAVQCFGRNSFNQAGTGGSSILLPQTVSGVSGAQEIGAGQYFSCARSGGQVRCWGRNDQGQFGNGSTTGGATPQLVSGISNATEIDLGNDFACAVRGASGTVSCWGNNNIGQLGDGTTVDRLTPVTAAGITGGVELTLGSAHTCVLHNTGQVRCWGAGGAGSLGHGMNSNSLTPVLVSGLADATALAGGRSHNCALRATGQVVCWGSNTVGQLGDGTTTQRNTPVDVVGLDDAIAIGAGDSHSCAIRSTGRLVCWGGNSFRTLGDGTQDNRHTPVSALGISDVVQIGSVGGHICGRYSTGNMACWGSNFYGQLGDGTTTARNVATAVSNLTDATDVAPSSNTWATTCAVDSSGQGWCWGSNVRDALGDGTGASSSVPVMVTGLDDAVEIAADIEACAVRTNQEVDCWGQYSGLSPVTKSGLDDAIAISAGIGFRCVLRATGEVSCWGFGEDGQTGTGNPVFLNNTPTPVVGLTDAIGVTTGSSHACALRANGTVVCWGANTSGQVGDGTFLQRNTPVAVVGLDQVVEIEAGGDHTCARRLSGQVLCWGENESGQVGDGSTTDRLAPVQVVGLGVAAELSLGLGFTCIRTIDQRVGCFGTNASGELGDGTNTDHSSWAPVLGL